MRNWLQGYFHELSLVGEDFLRLFRAFIRWTLVRIKLSLLYVVPMVLAIGIPLSVILWQIQVNGAVGLEVINYFTTHVALSVTLLVLILLLLLGAIFWYIVSQYHLLTAIAQIQDGEKITPVYTTIFDKKSWKKQLLFPVKVTAMGLSALALFVVFLIFLTLSINVSADITKGASITGVLMFLGVLIVACLLGLSVWKVFLGRITARFWYIWGSFGALLLIGIAFPSTIPALIFLMVACSVLSLISIFIIYSPVFSLIARRDHHYDVVALFHRARSYGIKHFWKIFRMITPFWITIIVLMELLALIHTTLQHRHTYTILSSELQTRNDIAEQTNSADITDQMLIVSFLSPDAFDQNPDNPSPTLKPVIRSLITSHTPSKETINKSLYDDIAPLLSHDLIESARVNASGEPIQLFPLFYWSGELLKGSLQWLLFSGILLFLLMSVKRNIDKQHHTFLSH